VANAGTASSGGKGGKGGKPPAPSSSSSTGVGPGATGYQKRESDRARAARLSSYAHQHEEEISEGFIDLAVEVRSEDHRALAGPTQAIAGRRLCRLRLHICL